MYSVRGDYRHIGVGLSALLVSTTMGNSYEPHNVKRAAVSGLHVFFCVLLIKIIDNLILLFKKNQHEKEILFFSSLVRFAVNGVCAGENW